MPRFHWVLEDDDGTDLARSPGFETREEAESWMGEEWASLRAGGTEAVTLVDDGEPVYRMSLREA